MILPSSACHLTTAFDHGLGLARAHPRLRAQIIEHWLQHRSRLKRKENGNGDAREEREKGREREREKRTNGDEIEKLLFPPRLLLPPSLPPSPAHQADTKRTIAISEKDSKMDEVSRSQRRKERGRIWMDISIYTSMFYGIKRGKEGKQMPRPRLTFDIASTSRLPEVHAVIPPSFFA